MCVCVCVRERERERERERKTERKEIPFKRNPLQKLNRVSKIPRTARGGITLKVTLYYTNTMQLDGHHSGR